MKWSHASVVESWFLLIIIYYKNCLCFQVTKVKPNDKDAKAKYQECNKIVKRIAFEKAIAVEDNKKSIVDTLKIENMGKWSICKAKRKKLCVPSNPTDPTKKGPTLNILFFYFQ